MARMSSEKGKCEDGVHGRGLSLLPYPKMLVARDVHFSHTLATRRLEDSSLQKLKMMLYNPVVKRPSHISMFLNRVLSDWHAFKKDSI